MQFKKKKKVAHALPRTKYRKEEFQNTLVFKTFPLMQMKSPAHKRLVKFSTVCHSQDMEAT